jgi:hypothetical protein
MASDAGIYGLANRPTTEALDPFEIARRRLSIQNALAAQQIQQQQIQTGAIGLENAQRDQAAEAAFRAQFMTPAAPGVPAVPNALAPAAMLPAGPGPGSAAWSPAAASVLPAPGGMPVNGAPGADSGPGGMLASPAPGAAPGATKTPAGVTLGDIPDSALYASFGSKAPGIIKARDEAAAAVATRQQKLGEVREQDQKFWGMLAGGWEHGNYDPRMIPGMLQIAAGHGLTGSPEFQQFAQLAQSGDMEGLKRLASLAITPDIRKTISESGAAAALATGRKDENTQKNVQNAGAFLSTVRDQGAWDKYLGELTKEDPAAAAKFADIPWSKNAPAIAQQRALSAEQQVTTAETAKRDKATATYQQGELDARRAELALNRSKTEFDQGAIQRAGEALGHGELTRLKDIASLRGDQRLQIYDIAKRVNPNFNLSEVDRQIKNEDYYANGKGADSLRSFNTFLEHGGAASDAVNQIRLSGVPAINKPLNWWREHMSGDPALTQLIGSIEPVRKEFEGFLLGGHALSVDDRRAANVILSDNSSPAQIQAALKTMGHTAAARANEENFRYKKVSKHDLEGAFSPEAIEGARKIGTSLDFGSSPAPATATPGGAPTAAAPRAAAAAPPLRLPAGSVSVTDPAGGVHYFPNKAAADEFKRLANIRD